MNASNHLLAGAGIALVIKDPAISLPLAILSHYLLDALPHYGHERKGFNVWRKHRSAYVLVVLDTIGSSFVIVTLLNHELWLALVTAVLATSPDIVWIYRFVRYERHGYNPPLGPFSKLHLAIQWCERPWGFYVEVIIFTMLFLALRALI